MNSQPHSGDPLPGFDVRRVAAGDVRINVRSAGDGPPLLLLHGYPQNLLTWAPVAPALAATHTVVLADLRGYGDSDKPTPERPQAYSKRQMAADFVSVMSELGFDRFAVAAHDRGARVAHRMTLDHPARITRLALLDIVPTRHVFAHVDRALAEAYFHWFLLGTGGGIPEHLIGADPEYWVRSLIDRMTGAGSSLPECAVADYVRCFRDPATVAATCADYRAGASIDLEHDDASFDAGQRIEVPTLILWGEQSYVGRGYDTMAVWRDYATDVRGSAVPAGHFVIEEAPQRVLEHLVEWFG
ncbi:alpha/beta hydrolase [Mycolicibacterium sp. 018/SC-01/001]|uniref:alpha/beta fold hydrolase n=1 Tax=Mycolicibacterium sp. 018/SC-01/001 TaxID=2592069 RepID=UPI00117C2B5A|nr:alpha/beta hydrolase [Mycolicibacterium sp. 018/SC-01/001]TRW80301.1 alpha/beta hydrolase [Mycolicibacterium sp. 018/SC-01/001]